MSVSVHDLHRLTAAAVERHKELHAHHHHVAHGVAAQRRAQAAAAAGLQSPPLSGMPGPVSQPAPVGGGRG